MKRAVKKFVAINRGVALFFGFVLLASSVAAIAWRASAHSSGGAPEGTDGGHAKDR